MNRIVYSGLVEECESIKGHSGYDWSGYQQRRDCREKNQKKKPFFEFIKFAMAMGKTGGYKRKWLRSFQCHCFLQLMCVRGQLCLVSFASLQLQIRIIEFCMVRLLLRPRKILHRKCEGINSIFVANLAWKKENFVIYRVFVDYFRGFVRNWDSENPTYLYLNLVNFQWTILNSKKRKFKKS